LLLAAAISAVLGTAMLVVPLDYAFIFGGREWVAGGTTTFFGARWCWSLWPRRG
jgi:uncharacterized membrane protein